MKAKYRLIILLSVVSPALMAQSIDRQAQQESQAALETKSENGYTYICGGVGVGEAAKMKKASRDHDMLLTFATKKGDYLADVSVDIKDAKGNTGLSTVCEGPLMLIDFPKSGTYRIRAEAAGFTLNKTAHIQAKGRSHASLILSWPQWAGDVPSDSESNSTGSSGENAEGHMGDEKPGDTDKMMDSCSSGHGMMECK